MNKTTNREEIPLPIRSEAPGTIMVKPPEDHTLFLPAEELDRLELEMLPELERIELEMLPELERLELEMQPALAQLEADLETIMDDRGRLPKDHAGADPGQTRQQTTDGGRQNGHFPKE